MNRRLPVILMLLVLVPVVGLGWLGLRLQSAEQRVVERRLRESLDDRLALQRLVLQRHLIDVERDLARQFADADQWSPEQHDALRRTHPLVVETFVLSPGAELLHPRLSETLSSRERDLVRQLNAFLRANPMLFVRAADEADASDRPATQGWSVRYDGSGLAIFFWRRTLTGAIAGIEVARSRLMADLVALLPDTPTSGDAEAGSFRLVDENGAVIYQWGRHEPESARLPDGQMTLDPPFAAWRFEYFLPADYFAAPSGGRLAFWAALAAGGVLILALAFALLREHSREMREAAQRVHFVNQVSHELKTPLTNIRLHAELLDESTDDSDPEARRRLDIIVAESQRLSRLIDNVLTFGREGRGMLTLQVRTVCLDDLVREIVERFRPVLRSSGIEIETALDAPQPVPCDPDAVGQILGNLIANVEKYAADGRHLAITTTQAKDCIVVQVADRGPGVPGHARERIFEPFCRLDDGLTARAAGTGIGLTIARKLAHLHGGSLELVQWQNGCTFELRLPIPDREAMRS
ncbi:MAG: HAMP domain-containing histidine kinase [Candidatus Sumerlaeia bacterium]|nr:HAMP domain-containing histidine kinase [Candidatus Sumerlaeia bacterium]